MSVSAGSREPYHPQFWRIVEKSIETSDVATLVLEPSSDGTPLNFAPGQFNMLYAFGCGEVAISISGDPSNDGRLVHTIRAVGSVTRPLTALEGGDLVGVRGPYGSAWPLADAKGKDLLFVAGGLGLAPLRPAIYAMMKHRAAFNRVLIVIGARDPDSLLYRSEVAEWGNRLDLDINVTVDRAGQDWRGNVGVILRPISSAEFDPTNAVAFICGPEIMMRLSAEALMGRGMTGDGIHVSLERNMKCAFARCGHCQYGPHFVCKDGPVFRFDRIRPLLELPEI